LKNNQKIKKFEYADNQVESYFFDNIKDEDNEFVVKEAELLISKYIEKIENQDLCGNKSGLEFERKYKKMRKIATMLGVVLSICVGYIVIV